jgi:hypothetical protein
MSAHRAPSPPARLAAAARALARRSLARRSRAARKAGVRITAPGAEPRTLPPEDPHAAVLMKAAETVLSAVERSSRR